MSVLALTINAWAQDLSISKTTSTELTKASKEGRYGGTFINGDEARVLFVSSTKEDGAQVEEYKMNIGGGEASVQDKFIDASTAKEQLPWFMPQSKVENLSDAGGKWLNATRAFGGGMKLFRGHIQKNYWKGIYTGMEFIEEEAIKPKTGDIWRITPGGYKNLSDVDAMATDNGFYREVKKYGNPLLMPADATLLAAGVITEKVKLTTDQEYAANRVAVMTMNGMDFEDMQYDIHILPYTAWTITSGLGQDDNLCSLFAPLNGPTTIKALKHLLWKDKKNYFTVMRFSDDRQLVDSVSFLSDLMWGDYQILNGHGSTYVLGKGNADFDGWYRGMEFKKMTGIQVTKIQDGSVVYSKLYGIDELEQKLTGPKGKKVKLDWMNKHNYFQEIINMPNGDAMIVGYSPKQAYVLQTSPSGELKAFYYLPMMGKEGETGIVTYQTMVKGDDLIFVANQRPVEFTTDAQFETSSFKSYGAGVVTTITTTTVTKLNEVFLQSMIVRMNTANVSMSNVIEFDGKDYYPMGSFPAMFTQNAVYFTGREKGPKGKVIHVARIDL